MHRVLTSATRNLENDSALRQHAHEDIADHIAITCGSRRNTAQAVGTISAQGASPGEVVASVSARLARVKGRSASTKSGIADAQLGAARILLPRAALDQTCVS
jgi:hypothetical protein